MDIQYPASLKLLKMAPISANPSSTHVQEGWDTVLFLTTWKEGRLSHNSCYFPTAQELKVAVILTANYISSIYTFRDQADDYWLGIWTQ